MHTAAVRRPARPGAVASSPARRAGAARHALLHLQQLAGNAAVATAVRPVVQRQLKMTGPAADVTAALAMLQAASGLTFKQDKAKLVRITGTPKPPQSAELARRLQAIIADDKRTAQIDFGHERVGVWFGAAPRDEKHPIQQLRIDHFLSLEKGVPGGGAAILAHEINENYEAQGLGEFNWEIAVSEAHERSLGVENTILDQIQQASGSKRSGDRLGTYTVVLPGATAKAPQRWLHIEAHEHEFFVFEEVGQGKKATVVTTRRPVVDLGTFTCRGFAAGAKAIPKGCDATLARVAELLSKEPTASVMLRSASKHGPGGWYDLVIEEIRARMVGNDDTKGWARFAGRPPHWAGGTTVELVVRRPDLP